MISLKSHVISVHDGISCVLCDKSFKSTELLKKHVAVDHLNDKGTFKCDLCSAKFILSIQLTRHKYYAHSEKVTCQYQGCRQLFNTKSSMMKHFKSIHTWAEFCWIYVYLSHISLVLSKRDVKKWRELKILIIEKQHFIYYLRVKYEHLSPFICVVYCIVDCSVFRRNWMQDIPMSTLSFYCQL